MYESILCLGGALDGEIIDVKVGVRCFVHAVPQQPLVDATDFSLQEDGAFFYPIIENQQYKRVRINVFGKIVDVMVHNVDKLNQCQTIKLRQFVRHANVGS